VGFKEIISAIRDVGFPVAIAAYLVVFFSRFTWRLVDRVEEMNRKLDKIIESLEKLRGKYNG